MTASDIGCVANLIAACAQAREVFGNAKRALSERPARLNAARRSLAEAEHRRDELQAEVDAGGNVDQNLLTQLHAVATNAKAVVENIDKNAAAETAAIETLRAKLEAARTELFRAIEGQRTAALDVAAAKFASGLQLVKDATAVVGRLRDDTAAIRMRVPDLQAGSHAWDRATPSPEVIEALRDLDPAIREIEMAHRAILR